MNNESMVIPIDIHTHLHPSKPGEAIENCSPESFAPSAGGWYSVGIHPWNATKYDDWEMRQLADAVLHQQVIAVGEAGLDKLSAAPMTLQMRLFEYQAILAEQINKPLIIHVVKATGELLEIKRRAQPQQPWIVHGFRGKAELAKQYLHHGFYLSFGERYQEDALRAMPLDRLLVETDESTKPIADIYKQMAKVLGIDVDWLEDRLRQNVINLFFS